MGVPGPVTKVASEGYPGTAAGDDAQLSTQILTPGGILLIIVCNLVPVSAVPAVPPLTLISSPLSEK